MRFDKQAMLRYFLIDYRLRNNPPPTTEVLRTYVENEINILTNETIVITLGMIKTDIREMKKVFFAPITFSFTNNSYKYDHNGSQFIKLPQLATDYVWNYLRLHHLMGPIHYGQEFIIYNDSVIAGNEKIIIFAKALKDQKLISFVFKPFNAKRSYTIILNPYILKEDRKAWYIIGNKLDGEIRRYPIHRIEGVPEILPENIQPNKEIPILSVEHSFNILGAKPIDILLDCKPEIRAKVISNGIHNSQKVVSNNGNGLRLSISAIPDEALISKLISYRNLIEVISPEKLRSFLAEELRRMLDSYVGYKT